MLFCVELLGLTCGHWLGRLTRLRSRTSATQLMMNCSPKLELSPTTFYMHQLLYLLACMPVLVLSCVAFVE